MYRRSSSTCPIAASVSVPPAEFQAVVAAARFFRLSGIGAANSRLVVGCKTALQQFAHRRLARACESRLKVDRMRLGNARRLSSRRDVETPMITPAQVTPPVN